MMKSGEGFDYERDGGEQRLLRKRYWGGEEWKEERLR